MVSRIGTGHSRRSAMKCTLCQDIGWVCETHPGKPWNGPTPVPAARQEHRARGAINMMPRPRACRRVSWLRQTRTANPSDRIRPSNLFGDDPDEVEGIPSFVSNL
jgi:hypothetical protein